MKSQKGLEGGGPSVRITTEGFAEVRKLGFTWRKGGIPEEKDKRGASKMGGLGVGRRENESCDVEQREEVCISRVQEACWGWSRG